MKMHLLLKQKICINILNTFHKMFIYKTKSYIRFNCLCNRLGAMMQKPIFNLNTPLVCQKNLKLFINNQSFMKIYSIKKSLFIVNMFSSLVLHKGKSICFTHVPINKKYGHKRKTLSAKSVLPYLLSGKQLEMSMQHKVYKVSKGLMHHNVRFSNFLYRVSPLSKKNSTVLLREYAVNRAHTPDPTTSSNESLRNNPPYSLKRTHGSVVGQHTEWTVQECASKECPGRVCTSLCTDAQGTETSVGHFTHSKSHATGKLSNVDLDGQPRDQFVKLYEESHSTVGYTRDAEGDKRKTEKLNNDISKTEPQNNDNDI